MLGSADRVVCAAAGSAMPRTMPGTPGSGRPGDAAVRRARPPRIITILTKLADLWPQTLLALGVILTWAWSGVLLWWLMANVGLT
jgi:hypothetical protein